MSFMNQPDDPLRDLPLTTEARPDKRAAGWQIVLTAIAAIAIYGVFLWGLTNQRYETTEPQTAATQATPVESQESKQQGKEPSQAQEGGQQQPGASNAPTTTGQGARDEDSAGVNADQKSTQQPDSSGQNAPPNQSNSPPPQPDAGARQPKTE